MDLNQRLLIIDYLTQVNYECYDNEWNVISCMNRDYPGQDGFYTTGCSLFNRFIDNGDGTVNDKCTGLMWQIETADINNDGKPSWGNGLQWTQALRYCKSLVLCNDGVWLYSIEEDLEPTAADIADHGGAKYGDWRLPNVKEIFSLVHYGADNGFYSVFNSGFRNRLTKRTIMKILFCWHYPFKNGKRFMG